jgi:signal transduction histidine kinase
LGWARVGLNDKALREQLEGVVNAGWFYALWAVGIGSLLALLCGNQLTAKLYAIRQVSRAVREGGYKARVPALGGDEAGQLAQDVNHMLDALAETSEKAEAASRAKSEFLASMSHELRTPLNAIMGYAQLLAAEPDVPQASQHQAQIINQAGAHLLALINDLIDLSRIESGKLQVGTELVSACAVLEESLILATPLAQKRGIKLHFEPCLGKLPMVRVDPVRLRQIILNLLANAIKYNHPQGNVRLVCQVNSGRVRIQVSDTGPGIPAAKQARLFQAFDRLGAERGEVEGSGIGLVITQRITQAMAGSIGFESSEGRGSTFWVEFPLSEWRVRPEASNAYSPVMP